jgi:hypothetical protein
MPDPTPEAGNHCSESRGLYRLHQFTKLLVELFIIDANAQESSSMRHLEQIVELQESILKDLNIHYILCHIFLPEVAGSILSAVECASTFVAALLRCFYEKNLDIQAFARKLKNKVKTILRIRGQGKGLGSSTGLDRSSSDRTGSSVYLAITF